MTHDCIMGGCTFLSMFKPAEEALLALMTEIPTEHRTCQLGETMILLFSLNIKVA